jgi:hypothetical protein
VEKRIKYAFGRKPGFTYNVIGTPKDLESACDLAARDKHQFQYWACSLLSAWPLGHGSKGADRGIDGVISFNDDRPKAPLKKIIVSVKGGQNLNLGMVRDLIGTVEKEKAAMGLFLTLKEPTAEMTRTAAQADSYVSPHGNARFPKIQIITIRQLLEGQRPKMPPDFTSGHAVFKKTEAKGKGVRPQGLPLPRGDGSGPED